MKENLTQFRTDAIKAASRFGTPTYFIYENKLKQNYDRFNAAFRKHWDKIDVSYSVKTNYLPAIVHSLYTIGATIEIVSEFELYLALKTGIPGNRIIYNGPCKMEGSIDLAVTNGVNHINSDSLEELQRIDRSAKRHGKKIRVGIRVSTEETWRRFGIPLENAAEAFKAASRMEHIDVHGIHVHIGTNVSPVFYVSVLEKILGLMRDIHSQGVALDFVDLGGGYPVEGLGRWGNPYKNFIVDALSGKLHKKKMRKLAKAVSRFKSEDPEFRDPPKIETYAEMICGTLKNGIKKYNLPAPTLILEPGRYIVNSAVSLLVKVLEIKKYKDKWVMVDGGTNLASSTETQVHRVWNVSNAADETENVILAGPLCHGGDILSNAARISTVRPGDIIAIMDIGAYNISQSRQFITPRANAVMVRQHGELEEVRRREEFEDVLILDSPFLNK